MHRPVQHEQPPLEEEEMRCAERRRCCCPCLKAQDWHGKDFSWRRGWAVLLSLNLFGLIACMVIDQFVATFGSRSDAVNSDETWLIVHFLTHAFLGASTPLRQRDDFVFIMLWELEEIILGKFPYTAFLVFRESLTKSALDLLISQCGFALGLVWRCLDPWNWAGTVEPATHISACCPHF